MGLGKTVVTLTALADLKRAGKLPPVLLASTIRIIKSVWRQEAKNWEHTNNLTFSLVHGNVGERRAALRKRADIYLINFENIQWLQNLLVVDRPKFGMFIADESSRLKAHNSKRFKALRRMLPEFKKRWLLTGTPAPNSLLDLWAQIYLLDEGARLGRTYYLYRQRFFEPSDWQGYTYVPRRNAARSIHRAVAPFVLRLDARDFLPPQIPVPNILRLHLPAAARAQYDELERRMFLQLDEIAVEAFNAAALTAKCWQFANGAIYGNGTEETTTRTWKAVHDTKLDALEEVLEEASGNPVLVAYWFKSDLARLLDRLGKNTAVLKGKEADQMILDWNAGRYPVMLAHPQTAAHGLNLQAGGHTIFWFSQTWSLELHDQYIARLARQGQKDPVIVHYPIMVNTTDEVMRDAILTKARGQGDLLDALRRYRDYRELL